MKKDNAPVANGLKAYIEALAESWPEGDTNVIDKMATAIESSISPDTDNEFAIKARKHAQLARGFGISEKGVIHIVEAQCAFKDYMLWGDALKGEKFPAGREKGSTTESTKHIHQLVADNPSLTAKELFQITDKNIISEMAIGTFKNHVHDARKTYPKIKTALK